MREELKNLVQAEFHHLTKIQASERRWQMPLAAALSSGLPLLVGAYTDQLGFGLTASLGGIVFLYLPGTPMHHRMVWLMACAFGMAACYAMGMASHFYPPIIMVVLTLIAIIVSMVCRFYSVGPPGSVFFIMVASLGAYSPLEMSQLPQQVGLLTLGCLLALVVAFVYSLHALRLQAPTAAPLLPSQSFDFVVMDSVVIGVFVGLSLFLAQALQLQRPYWVPVSCLAVIQGVTLRAAWIKQVHRIVGTVVGLLLAWALLSLPQDKWLVSLMVIALTFMVETLVVRHYAMAVIFITLLTLLLAESATLGAGVSDALIQSRFVDTALGCLVGLVGAACLHSPSLRDKLSRQLRRLVPNRFLSSVNITKQSP